MKLVTIGNGEVVKRFQRQILDFKLAGPIYRLGTSAACPAGIFVMLPR